MHKPKCAVFLCSFCEFGSSSPDILYAHLKFRHGVPFRNLCQFSSFNIQKCKCQKGLFSGQLLKFVAICYASYMHCISTLDLRKLLTIVNYSSYICFGPPLPQIPCRGVGVCVPL